MIKKDQWEPGTLSIGYAWRNAEDRHCAIVRKQLPVDPRLERLNKAMVQLLGETDATILVAAGEIADLLDGLIGEKVGN